MNLFRSLIGKVWQDPNTAEVVKISNGQLFLVRPSNIRSGRECIYNEAMATVRRHPSAEHQFSLVITRVYEEGDQELLEDEDETDEERAFLIGQELQFRTGEHEGQPSFIWRDLYGGVDEFYEFVATDTNEPTKAFFEICMYRAMYEMKYHKSAENVDDSALDEFIYNPEAPATATPAAPEIDPRAAAIMDNSELLVSRDAELYYWDKETESFSLRGIVEAQIIQQSSFEFWLLSRIEGRPLLLHRISPSMNHRLSSKMNSLTWNHLNEETGDINSWLFRFEDADTYEQYISVFSKAMYEVTNQIKWEKAKADEQQYYRSSYNEDVEMLDPEDEAEDEEAVLEELEPEEDESDEEEEEAEEDDIRPQLPKGAKNSQLTVGYKGDRSYVVRGNNIGVFSHTPDGVKYYGSISKVATPKGKEFQPKRIMLHDQDTKMVLMNPGDPNSLFHMDIERGKIVEEWKVHDDITVDHMAPESKFAPTTREQTLIGASHNALFKIDPRVSGSKLVDSQYKQYAGKNKFSGVATTESGKIAVASEKGDIRLFDTIGKNAKTALPPLGDAINGVDVTADGRWIIATTKTYILLIDTLIGKGPHEGKLGFDRSFPADAKPMPRRLQLRNEHIAYMNHDINFSPARFNQGEGQTENAIVTSTGQYVIAWDFAKVKKGLLDKYEIKKYEDHVVQDNFRFGDDKEIIVALDDNVLSVNKKALKKPTRVSLGSSLPSGKSGIVKTWE